MKLKTYETYATLIGLVAGIIYGQFIYDPNWSHGQLLTAHLHATELSILSIMGNTIFMGLLKMLIMPLIVVSVVSGIASTNGTGKIGTYTLLYYFATMLIAVTVGLILVTTFSPGVAYRESLGVAALESAVSGSSLSASLPENALTANSDSLVARFISMLIPENLFGALAKGETLPVIMFSIFLGIVLSKMGKRAQSLRDIFDSLFAVLINMV